MNKCNIEGCNGKYKGLGYCNKHYQRLKNNGDPGLVRKKSDNYPSVCIVDNCKNPFLAKGFCNKHYQRFKNTGNIANPIINEKCSYPGCDKPYEAKGYCVKHYTRKRNHGCANIVKYLKGYDSLLSCMLDNIFITENNCWNWQGKKRKGYGWMSVNGEVTAVHRFSYKYYYGEFNDSLFVCHHCDNRLCCNPEHLFLGTHSDNMQDCIKKNRHRWGENAPHKQGVNNHEQI